MIAIKPRIFTSFIVLLTLLSNTIANAKKATFDCENLDVVACKAKFGTQYDEETKYLYANIIKDVLHKYTDIYKSIVNELETSDPYIPAINLKIEKFTTKLQRLEEHNEIDFEDLVAFTFLDYDHFEPNFENIKATDDNPTKYYALFEKYGGTHDKIVHFFAVEKISIYDVTFKIWKRLYGAAKTTDLKNDSEMEELNRIHMQLDMTDNAMKSMIYWATVENSIKYLNMKFLKDFHAEIGREIDQKQEL